MTNHQSRNWTNRLIREAESLGSDLIEAYIRINQWAGAQTLKDVAAMLNDELEAGTDYSGTDLGKWRDGTRSVPAPVQAMLRRQVLSYIFYEVTSAKKSEKLAAVISKIMEPKWKR